MCIAAAALPLLLTGVPKLYNFTSLYLQTVTKPQAALVKLFVCRGAQRRICQECWVCTTSCCAWQRLHCCPCSSSWMRHQCIYQCCAGSCTYDRRQLPVLQQLQVLACKHV
jgi:hypothetical protein